MDRLKLIGLDEEDLPVLSAHCQDAVLKLGDITWLPAEKRVIVAMNRFVWEKVGAKRSNFERRRAVLHFERVERVQTRGLTLDNKEAVLSLLAITFTATSPPGGTVELAFAANATMRLEVECVEARLSDLAGAWEAGGKPEHDKA